jgi:hypothetical protein
VLKGRKQLVQRLGTARPQVEPERLGGGVGITEIQGREACRHGEDFTLKKWGLLCRENSEELKKQEDQGGDMVVTMEICF